ncbi:hypothetical protein C0Q70_03892 [Pomacea canaliculata]|uniref:Chitin-binding type-4 domain-containing protein n=1 Tax=Pomacea canaliculata TaxID=400727 RepID=A0A2T7PTZ5_POMCA|nr:hypothetical protein C0Q70_03892 [Pomacea canaliculata]
MQRQHETNKGRCGVCGDAYDDVKPLFIPPSGTFATGIVGRCYLAGTRYLSATVQLTSSHLGYFDFRLCVNNDFQKPVTQDCLDKTVLQIEDPDGVRIGTQYNITNFRPITLELQVLLPPGIRCTQCVLQWRYVAGNNWGCEGSGQKKRCGLGLGPQETFVNCADIAILESCTY